MKCKNGEHRLHQESNGGGRLSVGSSGLLGSPNTGPNAGELHSHGIQLSIYHCHSFAIDPLGAMQINFIVFGFIVYRL